MNLRLDIQGLRALAVLFVVLFHFQHEWLPGGFIGVDMFFVVSGFLISKGMITQINNKAFNYTQFIIGRIKRIVPAYIAMLIVATVVSYFILIPSDMLSFLYDLRTSLVFYSNQVFAEANNYFGAKSYEKSLLHTWSLSIEMQFYFLLPLLIYLVPKRFYKWVFGIGTILVIFYTQYHIDVLSEKSAMYFSLLARSAEFMIGIGVNLIPTSSKINRNTKDILGLTAVLTLFISVFVITENSSFPGLLAVPACLATALLIWLGSSKFNRLLSWSPLVYIGTLSYSLYLWHWPVLSLYRYHTMRYDLTIIEMVVASVIIAILTLGSYYLIEEPFRRTTKRKVFFGVASLATVTILLWFGIRNVTYTKQEIEQIYTSPNGFNMKNHANYGGYFLMGDKNKSDDSIVVIGDSHALVMNAFIDDVGRKNSFNFSYISTNSNVPLEGIPSESLITEYKDEYDKALPISNSLIKKSKIIIVVKQWQHRDNAFFGDVLLKLASKLNSSQKIIVVSDFPRLDVNPVRNYKSINKPLHFKAQKIILPDIPTNVKSIIADHSNMYFLDLRNEIFFKDAPYYKDTLMYYDEYHLNKYGSINYAKFEGHKLVNLIEEIKMNNNADIKVANK